MSRRKFSVGRESYIGSDTSPRSEARILASWVTSGRMSFEEIKTLVAVDRATERRLRAFANQGDSRDRQVVHAALAFRQRTLNELRRLFAERTSSEADALGQAKGGAEGQQTKWLTSQTVSRQTRERKQRKRFQILPRRANGRH